MPEPHVIYEHSRPPHARAVVADEADFHIAVDCVGHLIGGQGPQRSPVAR